MQCMFSLNFANLGINLQRITKITLHKSPRNHAEEKRTIFQWVSYPLAEYSIALLK